MELNEQQFVTEKKHFVSLPICKQQVLFHFISFSRFRCSCSRKCHSKKDVEFGRLEKTTFLSLVERRRRKLKFNLFVHSQTRFLFHFHCLIAASLNQTGINLFLNKGRFWHPMKNRHPLKIEKSDKCHYYDLIRRYFTSLLLLTHSSRS